MLELKDLNTDEFCATVYNITDAPTGRSVRLTIRVILDYGHVVVGYEINTISRLEEPTMRYFHSIQEALRVFNQLAYGENISGPQAS